MMCGLLGWWFHFNVHRCALRSRRYDTYARIIQSWNLLPDYYDGGGGRGGIGGPDGGGEAYDVDLDTVRAYNKVAKEAQANRIYWDELKNRSHRQLF